MECFKVPESQWSATQSQKRSVIRVARISERGDADKAENISEERWPKFSWIWFKKKKTTNLQISQAW